MAPGSKQKIFLVVGGLIIALIFIEFGLRLSGYSSSIYEFDSKTGMSILRPDNSFNWIKDCFKNRVETNSSGFHDREFNLKKPEVNYHLRRCSKIRHFFHLLAVSLNW